MLRTRATEDAGMRRFAAGRVSDGTRTRDRLDHKRRNGVGRLCPGFALYDWLGNPSPPPLALGSHRCGWIRTDSAGFGQ